MQKRAVAPALSVAALSATVYFYHLQTLKADHIFSSDFRFSLNLCWSALPNCP